MGVCCALPLIPFVILTFRARIADDNLLHVQVLIPHSKRRIQQGDAMRVVVLLCVVLLLPLSVAVGKIYKWVDQRGTVHFTDNPAAIPASYRDQIETLAEPDLPRPQPQAPDAVPVQAPQAPREMVAPLQRVGNTMVVQAMLNGFVQAPLVVDTGAAFTVISTASARRLGLDLQRAAVIPMQSVSGPFLAWLTKVRSISVGGATVDDVEVVVHDMSPGENVGLLGMSFLDSFQVTISAASHAMRLTLLHEDANSDWFGGKSEDWWKRQFRFYRQQLAQIDAYLASKPVPELEQTRRYFRAELASLERRASRAAVPRKWRY
jgi:clan AA aspartic protease (TIGR02281 family)